MKRLIILMTTTSLIALALSGPTPTRAQSGCGIKPYKPIVPLGCSDLVPLCQCDADGKNCAWVWICTKKKGAA